MIVLINPNATQSMTDEMQRAAQAQAPDVEVQGWTSVKGPAAIQGPQDGDLAVPPMLELVQQASDLGAGAILIGCFDDTGLAEAQEMAACPVFGIGQAAYHLAAMLGGRFSVVTTLAVSVPVLEANIETYKLGHKLGRVRASGVPVLDVHKSEARVLEEICAAEAEDGVQTVVLGCGGMVDLPARAKSITNLRLIDGVRAATSAARAVL